jgi:DNA-binding CsgD family transcriptional regulator
MPRTRSDDGDVTAELGWNPNVAALHNEWVASVAERKSDIGLLGDVAWGTHVCLLYETTEDLLGTLVPYFKAGLENNEFCIWAVSGSPTEEEVEKALAQGIPGFDRYLASRRFEILPSRAWLREEDPFDPERILHRWEQELNRAMADGYAGVRAGGNALGASRPWSEFCAYERALAQWIVNRPISAVCGYPLARSSLENALEMSEAHQVTIARRDGDWEIINIARGRAPSHPLTPRELEVLGLVAQGKSAREIGDILGIAKRTVDEHVQTVVRKLNAENRTHAVAIALRDKVIEI